jgi:cytochrome c peroxidase
LNVRVPTNRISVLYVTSIATLLVLITLGVAGCRSEGGADQRWALRRMVNEAKLQQLDVGPRHSEALVKLGQALFFDPELSGNRDISCATCHHPNFSGGDALPVSIGTGGTGLSSQRHIEALRSFIARNATEIFNRGAPQWTTMFWDSRVRRDIDFGMITPAGDDLPSGLPNVLVVQAMFPVLAANEMRGIEDEAGIDGTGNELADLEVEQDIWDALMVRLLAIDGYVTLFKAAFPNVPTEQLTFAHAAIAIAAFESDAFAFTGSPWDRFVAGQDDALTVEQARGGQLFFGKAGCSACHSGPLLTDQKSHNMASPQIGPGRDVAAPDDFGRFGVTFDLEDLYAFRTPPLRNVELTGPWFHNGAYTSLEEAVRHHVDPLDSMKNYPDSTSGKSVLGLYEDQWAASQFAKSAFDKADAAIFGPDTFIYTNELRTKLIAENLDTKVKAIPSLSDAEIADILAFLGALTDPAARHLSGLIPDSVPSGLPVER